MDQGFCVLLTESADVCYYKMLNSEVIIRCNSSVRKVKLESLKYSFSDAAEGQNIGLFPFYQVF